MDKFSTFVLIFLIVHTNYSIGQNHRTNTSPDNDFSIEFSPSMQTIETLNQTFKCNPESHINELNYFKTFDTKLSCNDWNFKRMNTSFNMTIDGRNEALILNNIDTFSSHVNGHLILVQSGPIREGVCAGGHFDKLVFNIVDPNGCHGKGVTFQSTLYASVRLTGGHDYYCQAFCFGNVGVGLTEGIRNGKQITNPINKIH